MNYLNAIQIARNAIAVANGHRPEFSQEEYNNAALTINELLTYAAWKEYGGEQLEGIFEVVENGELAIKGADDDWSTVTHYRAWENPTTNDHWNYQRA